MSVAERCTLLCLMALFVVATLASTRDASAKPQARKLPLVLVLDVAGRRELQDLRERFANELGMALDEFMTVRVEVGGDFGDVGLAEQLRRVTPLVRQYDAVAVAWLDRPLPELLIVTLLVLDSGRVLVRTIPANAGGTPSSLALAARELLGTAYMFDKSPPPEVKAIAVDVARTAPAAQVARTTPSVSSAEPPGRVALRASVGALGPIHGATRAPLTPSLVLGTQLSLTKAWAVLALAEVGHASQRYDDVGRTNYDILGARLGAGYRVDFERLAVMPSLLGRFGEQRWVINPTGGGEQTLNAFYAQLAAGAAVTWAMTPRAQILLEGLLAWDPKPSTVKSRSDASVVHRSAELEWGATIGWLTLF